ncbi:MAG: helix-turn-helix domain-containing protein [Mucilaginibacter sp.]
MKASQSKFYKLPLYDGLEALDSINHNTPFPFHFHPTFNISIVYNGIFRAKLSDKLVNTAPGSILITNPGEIHANPCQKDDIVTFFTFYIPADFLYHCNGGKIVRFHQNVIDDAVLFDLLHRLRLALKYGSDKQEEANPYPLFEDFLAEENYEKFSLPEAAKRFGIDKYKFLRLFKFQTGLTPNNYFILKRIEKSKIMLTDGHDLLGIAIDLGFYDTAHFCNHFKKFTGISPIAYTSGT